MDDSSKSASTSGRIPKLASSVHDANAEKPPFGSRFLTDETNVWTQNAWDHVPPPTDQGEVIAAALAKQHLAPVPEDDKPRYNDRPARHWDNFYKMNSSNFFRNRKWLHLEFPELVKAAEPNAGKITIAEIGCGAGNAVFPLLAANQNTELSLLAFDYSAQAVKLVQSNPLYTSPPVGSIRADVWDLSSPSLPPGVEPGSVDIVTLVFVLSALHPAEWAQAIQNIHRILKPGGLVVMRDYGRYDLTQLRFKSGRLLDENFYIRGDKTRVYFFELDELALLFTGALAPSVYKQYTGKVQVEEEAGEGDDDQGTGSPALDHTPGNSTPEPSTSSPLLLPDNSVKLEQLEQKEPESPSKDSPSTPDTQSIHPLLLDFLTGLSTHLPHPLFNIEQLGVDRRLIVNRKRQLKMYRVWMQGKFRKSEDKGPDDC
ncbi:S-adenosyl-L-methionine-dependent methyltransferase [Abortiporus biennis]|nr:S-adenosyl-L-methionine-dependent methyltransferase [Abortiporus biennis]